MTKKIYNEDEAKSIKKRIDSIKKISNDNIIERRNKLSLIQEKRQLRELLTL